MTATTPLYGFPYPQAADPASSVPAHIQATATAIESTLASLYGSSIPGAGWTAFPYAGPGLWGDPSGFQTGRYSKVGSRVYVEVYALSAGSRPAGDVVGTLPIGFRPPAAVVRPTVTNTGGTLTPQLVTFNTDGTVKIGGAVTGIAAVPITFDFATN